MSETRITKRIRTLAIAGVAAIALPLAATSFQPADFAIAQVQPAAQVQPVAPATLPSGAVSYAPIVAANKPAVVTIRVRGEANENRGENRGQDRGMSRRDLERELENTPFGEFFRRFFESPDGQFPGPQGRREGPRGPGNFMRPGGLGSGFIVTADGMIVTNNHVVADSSDITVVLDDGTELKAKLVGTDPKTDLAVIKVDAGKDLPFVSWGDSNAMQVGDPVLAIGNPFGIGTTVTAGIVSARGRDLRNGPYDDFLQVDAPINRGNSGGPLLSMEGKVIGVNAAIYSPNGGNVGVGFAIPSVQAQDIVARLMKSGSIERGYIGVSIQPVSEEVAEAVGLPKAEGAIVAEVNEASAALKAGIETGDIVTGFNGKPVDGPRALARAVADVEPGAKTKITVWRQGKEVELDITVGKMTDEEQVAAATPGEEPKAASTSELAGLGIEVAGVTADTRERLGLPEEASGVVVTEVAGDEAGEAGIREGDIVLSINQEPVSTVAQARDIVGKAKEGGKRSVLMLVQRGENRTFVAVPFAAS